MLRLALIGCGGISHMHRERFSALADRMRVTVTADIDADRARRAAEEVGADLWVTDYEEAIPHCDAALIALPHHLHHPAGMAFLEGGKHVLMEKPLANSDVQCLELIGASRRARRTLMVAYCMRYHPLVPALKEAMEGGRYGETFRVSIWTEQLTEVAPDHWAADPEKLGGGQLFSHGCHYVDLLLYYLGRPVIGSHLGTNLGTPWMAREGTSDLILKFESGAVGYHGATWGARGSRLGYSIHVHTDQGMLEADISHGRLSFLRAGEETVLLDCGPLSKYGDREMAHFLDCIETGVTPITDGPDSVQGLRVIWRVYEAERQGKVADLHGLGLNQAGRRPAVREP